jgi:hypothetical protein
MRCCCRSDRADGALRPPAAPPNDRSGLETEARKALPLAFNFQILAFTFQILAFTFQILAFTFQILACSCLSNRSRSSTPPLPRS